MPTNNNKGITLADIRPLLPNAGSEQLCLTVLFHPDVSRIGEVALLGEPLRRGAVVLGRDGPLFEPATGGAPRPLQDPRLDDQLLRLNWSGGQLRLEGGDALVDGRALDRRHSVGDQALRRGVTLTLARRVVLHLHHTEVSEPPLELPGLVGESVAMRRVRTLVATVAPRDTTVLLTGESGTGKELVARAVHTFGQRRDAPLVTINMAAMPVELASAELFGVRRGAYTGANADRQGYLQRAHGGTLFMDEIGDCPRPVQSQLLRVLQEGEVQPAGGEVERVDVRFVAATDARVTTTGGDISNALRHRLGGFEVRVPPLRERREDIGRLLAMGLADLPLAPRAAAAAAGWAVLFDACARYDWPGNVRELLNVCQQVELLTGDKPTPVVPPDLQQRLWPDLSPAAGSASAAPRRAARLSDTEVHNALQEARWQVSRAAEALAVSRQALYNRIQSIPGLRVAADLPVAEVKAAYHEFNGGLEDAAAQLQVSAEGLRRRWRALDLSPGEPLPGNPD